ncbi:MAG: DHH family phosphoesterase [Leptospirales bacterium]|nr:DHH family phosphoesterase [Leptospirales bacterium]
MDTEMKEKADEFIGALKKFKNILILVKGSPDPDVLASSFALKIICDHLGIKTQIAGKQKLSLAQNKVFANKLGIHLKIAEHPASIDKFDAYAVLDHQSARTDDPTELPCVIHIDHHDKVKEDIHPIFSCLMPETGSTCTIIALLLQKLDIEFEHSEKRDMMTALLFGLQTDTDNYNLASPYDFKALIYIAADADNELINKISGIPMSAVISVGLEKAIAGHVIYKDWLIAGIGYIKETERDTIAIIADILTRRHEASVVFIFAIIQRKKAPKLVLDVSVRTEHAGIDLNRIIKHITLFGGARKFKGAFQIDLDFFEHYHDKQSLWDIVNVTAIEAIKHQRDKKTSSGIKSLILGRLGKKFD